MTKIIPASFLLKIVNNGVRIQISRTCYSDRISTSANDFFTSHTSNPVKIRMEENMSPGNYPPILVQTMMRNTVSKYGKNTAIVSSDQKINWNYEEYFQQVKTAAKGFISLGLSPLHGVGIMAPNHPYWFVSSLGAIFAGGLRSESGHFCGLYPTNTATTVRYICQHAPLDLIVLQNVTMLENLLQNEPAINETIKSFILLDDSENSGGMCLDFVEARDKVFTWKEMLHHGKLIDDSILEEKEKQQVVNQACALMYTSGTTGNPKGAMISHDNITWSSRLVVEQAGQNQERLLSYLPLSHVAAFMSNCLVSICAANEVHFADPNALQQGTLIENAKRVRPTRLLGVPRVWEKIMEKLQVIENSRWSLKILFRLGKIPIHQELALNNKSSYNITQKFILRRIRKKLGLDQASETFSASAPLQKETFDYFQSLGITLCEIYGSTETLGVQTSYKPGTLCRPGSVGKSLDGVYNKILNPDEKGFGEIATRSRNVFMGYHNDEEKTQEAFDPNGWFKSGDIGRLDQDGYLWISGRIKELIITSGGENIAPIPIENRIKNELPEIISNVVVVGDQKKYLTCLITLKCQIDVSGAPTSNLDEEAAKFCQKVTKDSIATVEEFEKNSKLNDLIPDAVNRANSKAIAKPHKVQKFKILPLDLSLSGGEFTPTLKLKRHFITKKYSSEISEMYD